jgi:uncharacterized protein
MADLNSSPHPFTPNPFTRVKARHLVIMLLLFAIATALLTRLLEIVTHIPAKDPLWMMVGYLILMPSLTGWLIWQLRSVQGDLTFILGKMPRRPHYLRLAGLTIATLVASLACFCLLLYGLFVLHPDWMVKLMTQTKTVRVTGSIVPELQRVLTAIVLVIAAPLTEEFIFRGFLFHRWAIKWGVPTALITTSILFGILHTNFIGAGLFGFINGLLYVKTKTLWMPIALHAMNNAIACAGMFASTATATSRSPSDPLKLGAGFGVTGVMLLVLSAPWIIRFIIQNFPRRDVTLPYFANQSRI